MDLPQAIIHRHRTMQRCGKADALRAALWLLAFLPTLGAMAGLHIWVFDQVATSRTQYMLGVGDSTRGKLSVRDLLGSAASVLPEQHLATFRQAAEDAAEGLFRPVLEWLMD